MRPSCNKQPLSNEQTQSVPDTMIAGGVDAKFEPSKLDCAGFASVTTEAPKKETSCKLL